VIEPTRLSKELSADCIGTRRGGSLPTVTEELFGVGQRRRLSVPTWAVGPTLG
jgi:hypothetical protein